MSIETKQPAALQDNYNFILTNLATEEMNQFLKNYELSYQLRWK